jgi:hypothetical protein
MSVEKVFSIFDELWPMKAVTKTVVPTEARIKLGPGQSLLRPYEIDLEPVTGGVASSIKMTAQIFNPHTLLWVDAGSTFFRVVRWA